MKIKRKVCYLSTQCLIYIFTFILFSRYFKHVYLFGWLSHNKCLYLSVGIIILLLTTFKSERLGYVLAFGNLVGLIVGHYLGELIRKINMSKITGMMDEQMKYKLSKN